MMSRILPIAFLLIAIAVFFGYTKPTWQGSVANLSAQIDTYDNALAAAQEFNEQKGRLADLRNQIPNADLERLQTFLPNGVDNIQLILDLTELANRTGVELSNFDTPTPEEQDASEQSDGTLAGSSPVESLTLTMDAAATYADFRTFLAGMERSLRPLDVTAIRIEESDTGVYDYQITLRFYWLR